MEPPPAVGVHPARTGAPPRLLQHGKGRAMHNIIYIIGAIVVILAILSFVGLA